MSKIDVNSKSSYAPKRIVSLQLVDQTFIAYTHNIPTAFAFFLRESFSLKFGFGTIDIYASNPSNGTHPL
jgi:hypothetical protein